MLDLFRDDAYGVVELTKAINLLPSNPGRLGRLGWFKEQGVDTLSVQIELQYGKLGLVPTAARGSMPNVMGGERRTIKHITVPHIPLNSTIMASEVQGVRAFGDEDVTEVLNTKVNNRLEKMKNNLEVTKEFHRAGAVAGKVLDADGTTVLYDIFDVFGITEDTVEFDFGTDDMKTKALEVIRSIEDDLGGSAYTQVAALCGDEFFDALIADESVAGAFELAQQADFFMTQQAAVGGAEQGFEFGGIVWYNYRGKVGSVNFIAADECRFVPLGTADLFDAYYAPAEFIETVNTIGKPWYAKQRVMDWDVGVELHVQTNPLFMCNRPKVLKKGTIAA